jgi:hypothetical protein
LIWPKQMGGNPLAFWPRKFVIVWREFSRSCP